ncbi:hypothetical protein B0H16DRAFT_1364181 [Mycena metata]|uniref:F-box domain-containing protein n=1 Tax=Mycena metata TaxID=1033252 RepID=A0AAD7JTI1_9AGAR|nr:hypothetical protein B0H16DRAFT_1364181 [Mycena metata]
MEAEFLDRLYTNYIPSDEEIERIQTDLTLKAAEFGRLDKLIQSLCIERDKIGAYLDSHKALISHPRRLPRDIVQEIFLACLPTDRNAVMSPTEAPVLLCRICSAWRNIAHTTPQLWASIHIPFHFVLADERRMHALDEWLQRSAACSLSLSLVGNTWDHGWDRWGHSNIFLSSEGLEAIHRLLIRAAPRWRCVELGSFDPSMLRQLAEVHAPGLELLKISGDLPQMVGPADAELRKPELALFTGEHLRELYLCSSNPSAFKPNADWSQLTHLSISRPSSAAVYTPDGESIHALELLQKTPRLVSFELGPNVVVESIPEALTLAFLRRLLILQSSNLFALEDLFEHLWLPDLLYFALAPHTDAGNALKCLSKNSPLVQHLFCSVPSFICGLSDPEMFSSFFPALVHLELTESDLDYTDDLLRRLTPGASSPVLIYPALTELVVTNSFSLSVDVLQTFLEQRVNLSTPFRYLAIRLRYGVELSPSYEDCMAPFREHGLDASVTVAPLSNSEWRPSEVPLTPWIGLPSYDSMLPLPARWGH